MNGANFETMRAAIETSDAKALIDLYAEDATMRIIDRANPPSRPRQLRGKAEIGAFYEDVCGRAMTHRIDDSVAAGDRFAFTETCEYPDGARVVCAAMIELAEGRIARQTNVQAWDE